jgi:hypothetical protein
MKIQKKSVSPAQLIFLLCCVLGLSEARVCAQGAFRNFGGESAAPSASALSYDIDGESSFFGRGDANAGSHAVGHITEISSSADFVLSAQVTDTALLRLGVEWQRYGFDPSSSRAAIPDSVQGLDLAIGADLQVSPAVLLRIEAHPGTYSEFHDITWQDFNVPFEIAATYFVSSRLLIIGGLHVDVNADTPVFPVIGVHWKVSDKWVIEGIAPRPQLQYLISDKVTLFAGADLRETTFRMNEQFGQPRGIPKLNDAILDYFEIRAGGGVTWKVSKSIDFEVEGGCAPYRRFEYPRADGYKVKSEDWSPYLRVALSAKF